MIIILLFSRVIISYVKFRISQFNFNSLKSVQFTVYNIHCKLYNIHCTLYSVQYTLYNVHYTMY